MIINDLNSLVGSKAIHYLYYVTNAAGVTTNTQINSLITKSPIASLG